MNEVSERKCLYFNSGYCKFSKREYGCKRYHPEQNCQITGCKDKVCPYQHPKKCKFAETCRFQSRCAYSHDNNIKERSVNEELDIAVKEIDKLKAEIMKLQEENDNRVNLLVRVHLREIEDFKIENIALKVKVESQTEALGISNTKNNKLKQLNTVVEAKNKTLMKKLLEVEYNKKYIREYQCEMCDFESRDKNDIINHMTINHEEVDKQCYVNEDTSEDGELCIEDCAICKKIFYSEESLKKHGEGSGTCGLCMKMDNCDQKYCSAMEH